VAEPLPLPTPAQLVTLTALLVPLMRLCLLIVCMGVVASVDALTRALFGTLESSVGWIPFLGRVVSAPIHRIEQKVSNYMGGLESHIDVSMGGYFHALADALGRLASGEAEAGWVFYWLAKAHRALRATVDALPSLGSVHSITRTVVKQIRVVVKQVDHVGVIAAHAAPAVLTGRVGVIEGELEDLLRRDIPSLRHRAKWLEDRLIRLGEYIHRNAIRAAAITATGAIALALPRLGLGWLRCSSLRRLTRAFGCRGFGAIEEVLLGAVTALAAVDICDFADGAYRVAQELQPVLLELVDMEDALIGCHGATKPPDLGIPARDFPPVFGSLRLAA
jgi:nitroreductase